MTKFNVCRPKKFNSGGQEKTMWLQVGVITKFDNGGMILEMNHLAETYQIFPFKEKLEQSPDPTQQAPAPTQEPTYQNQL